MLPALACRLSVHAPESMPEKVPERRCILGNRPSPPRHPCLPHQFEATGQPQEGSAQRNLPTAARVAPEPTNCLPSRRP